MFQPLFRLLRLMSIEEYLCYCLFEITTRDTPPSPPNLFRDADYIMSILEPELSERGSPRHAKENAIINFFQDFLENLESSGLCRRPVTGIIIKTTLTQQLLQIQCCNISFKCTILCKIVITNDNSLEELKSL